MNEETQTNIETLFQCLKSADPVNCIKLFIEENPDNVIAKDMLNDFLEIETNTLELEKHMLNMPDAQRKEFV